MKSYQIGLWKYNEITGYWIHQRNCNLETSKVWLKIFQEDEPYKHFILSKKTPTHKPK